MIGHIDRAWGYSIQSPKVAGPQILTFRNSLGSILSGMPTAMRYTGNSPRASPRSSGAAERDLADSGERHTAARPRPRHGWIERNDAPNYVLLGDPAVRIRTDVLT